MLDVHDLAGHCIDETDPSGPASRHPDLFGEIEIEYVSQIVIDHAFFFLHGVDNELVGHQGVFRRLFLHEMGLGNDPGFFEGQFGAGGNAAFLVCLMQERPERGNLAVSTDVMSLMTRLRADWGVVYPEEV